MNSNTEKSFGENNTETGTGMLKAMTIKKKKYPGRVKVIGDLRTHKNFTSEFLRHKRDVQIWLPPSYNNNTNIKYPVLYMHDGQNLFDPKTSYAGMDWRVDETLTKLIKRNQVEEVIVVGINNSPDRLEEYSASEKGKGYISFIINELKPFVDDTYRTLTDAANTAVMGSSMGGLISFLIAWNHPDVFAMAGCLSSSFYYHSDLAIKMVNDYNGEKKPVKFYIDHGEDGLIRGQQMFVALSKKEYVIGTDIDYFYAPGAEHNENEWAARLERPLRFFFNKKTNKP